MFHHGPHTEIQTPEQRDTESRAQCTRQEDVINTLSRQLDKAFNKAPAKLSSLCQSTDSLEQKINPNKHLVDDKLFEKLCAKPGNVKGKIRPVYWRTCQPNFLSIALIF